MKETWRVELKDMLTTDWTWGHDIEFESMEAAIMLAHGYSMEYEHENVRLMRVRRDRTGRLIEEKEILSVVEAKAMMEEGEGYEE